MTGSPLRPRKAARDPGRTPGVSLCTGMSAWFNELQSAVSRPLHAELS